MKLFDQPLEKLLNQKAMKQLKQTINSKTTTTTTTSNPISYRQQSTIRSWANMKRKQTSTVTLCRFNSLSDTNNNNNSATLQRHQLQLAVLPEPIRNLLNELYLRGPTTVGIFRKSPSARHCKELRQKLETDSLSSVAHYQVNVIASVFKEWLRSLPDCLLMSRLYPQWIDVAKLIEPLYENQQRDLPPVLNKQHQSRSEVHLASAASAPTQLDPPEDSSHCDTTSTGNRLRPTASSPLTDNMAAAGSSATAYIRAPRHTTLDRARSCVRLISVATSSEFSISSDGSAGSKIRNPKPETRQRNGNLLWNSAQLSERHFECLRIVRQLLDSLNDVNLILLRAFVCILWHISNNSSYNMMSACNLGVCVGQSLLNDDRNRHRNSNTKSSSFGFTKRHSRFRSQCLLPSILPSVKLPSPANQHQLPKQQQQPLNQATATDCRRQLTTDSSSAQETVRYVPLLVAFFIENALALFGPDISELFETNITPSSLSNTSTTTSRRPAALQLPADNNDELNSSLPLSSSSTSSRASSSTSGVHSASPVSSSTSHQRSPANSPSGQASEPHNSITLSSLASSPVLSLVSTFQTRQALPLASPAPPPPAFACAWCQHRANLAGWVYI